MGLRLSESLILAISDNETMQVHLRNAKGGKDRIIPLAEQILLALRAYWKAHRHSRLLFQVKEVRVTRLWIKGVFKRR